MISTKRVFLLLLCAAWVPAAARAAGQEERAQEKEEKVEIDIEAGTFASAYMWRGIRLSEGPVYQSSVTIGSHDFSFNLWGNVDFDSGRFNEMDITVSYSRDVKKFSIGTGFIHYGTIDAPDSDELCASFSADYPFQPSIEAFFDINAGKGAFLRASAGHGFKLSPRVSLELKASMGIVFHDSFMGTPDSGEEFNGLHNAEVVIAFPIQISRGWAMKLQAGASTPLSHNARQAIVNGSVCDPGHRFCDGTVVYGSATFTYAF